MDVFDGDENESKDKDSLLINLHNNRALIFLKKKDFKNALLETEKTLDMDEKNVKALLRKGKVWYSLQQYEDALDIYNKVLELLPNDKETLAEIKLVKQAQAQLVNKEKSIYKGFFKQSLYESPEDKLDDPSNPKVWFDIQIEGEEPQRVTF